MYNNAVSTEGLPMNTSFPKMTTLMCMNWQCHAPPSLLTSTNDRCLHVSDCLTRASFIPTIISTYLTISLLDIQLTCSMPYLHCRQIGRGA